MSMNAIISLKNVLLNYILLGLVSCQFLFSIVPAECDMYCHTEEQVSGSVYFISSVLCILSYLKINKRI